ncbi:AAA domain-containing protein [Chytriomyces cf. hyalinus JEL632]|nr:AAA domain-containing protein [Chytriomyces cf. hyalinus JEL632]
MRRMGVKSTHTNKSAIQRIEQVRRLLNSKAPADCVMRIGSTRLNVPALSSLRNPEKVPLSNFNTQHVNLSDLSQETLSHLEWLMKRVSLGQDVFLMGPPPSSIRRNLVSLFLSLAQREMDYISLHRDVAADSDLKQRREIVRSSLNEVSVKWTDSVAVDAALNGRVLVIEGIERAERNVLTVLNNLLENREMNLEDGRHIIHPTRYDDLLKSHSLQEMDKLGLLRCSEDFLVIALGLPVPPFPGNLLDPPFRSRFQVRYIPSNLGMRAADEQDSVRRVIDVIQIINQANTSYPSGTDQSLESAAKLLLPRFPETAVSMAGSLLHSFPAETKSAASVFQRVWPQSWIGKKLTVQQEQSLNALVKQNTGSQVTVGSAWTQYKVAQVIGSDTGVHDAQVKFESVDGKHTPLFTTHAGTLAAQWPNAQHLKGSGYIETPRQTQLLSILMQCHVLNHIPCVVGTNGSGKSTSIHRFAEALGYERETIHLYRDMTARDLIARRGTRADGSTCWQDSGLISAAKEGKLAILDGIEWLTSGALASLQRFLEDGQVELPDNSSLLRSDIFDGVMLRDGVSASELNARNMFRMHPSFRVIAVANVPHTGSTASGANWMNEEIAAMFHFVKVDEMHIDEERAIVKARTNIPDKVLEKLLKFTHEYRTMTHSNKSAASSSQLSTRQLIRISSRVASSGNQPGDLYTAIWRECLASFLPSLVKASVESLLEDCGIKQVLQTEVLSITQSDSHLTIGSAQVPLFQVSSDDVHSRSLIPTSKTGPSNMSNKGFFDNPLQTRTLRDLALDFNLGEHLLLIGNQGVGKNKLTDRFLELLNRPREYMQLHRDTTVSSLTATPTLENGLIVLQDSPLLRAVKEGRVVMIDEADKAPVMISACLKSLAESGEMGLVDGRKIRRRRADQAGVQDDRIIWMHPDFRMIILANRPGYPFMGNEFFSTIGEAFSCHPIENPDAASEIELIRQAAPTVDIALIKKLVAVFGDLRKAFDEGSVTYPYSLRELLNIVRHISAFPQDSLGQVIRNVFDFDMHRPDVGQLLARVFEKHGLDVTGFNNIAYTSATKLSLQMEQVASKTPPKIEAPKHGQVDPKNDPHIGGSNFAGGTGGSNTAGLGGRGGPYRLSSGNPVHQLSDAEKSKVPPHVLEAARKMGQDALKKRLEEIKMNPYEADMYLTCLANVREDVQKLRVVLEGVQAREKERVWIKNQTVGELDDVKLVEGISGETAIYKSRGVETQAFGGNSAQQKPKRIKLVLDCSGSMYRFNGYDGRLNRSLETALMVMESMDESFRTKFVYDIVGHSGDSTRIDLVSTTKPPTNEMERLRVLQNMSAHSQYCWSGDNTVSATRRAIQDIVADEADAYLVIVISDANLRRYGITAAEVESVLDSDPRVQAAMIFIGSLGDEAAKLVRALPRGKAYLALDTAKIPGIVKELFSSITE